MDEIRLHPESSTSVLKSSYDNTISLHVTASVQWIIWLYVIQQIHVRFFLMTYSLRLLSHHLAMQPKQSSTFLMDPSNFLKVSDTNMLWKFLSCKLVIGISPQNIDSILVLELMTAKKVFFIIVITVGVLWI